MPKNLSFLLLLLFIIFLISLTNTFVTKISKEKLLKEYELKYTTKEEGNQENFLKNYLNNFGVFSDRNRFITKINIIFSKYKIRKGAIFSKEKLRKIFFELFNDNTVKKKEEETIEEEIKNKEYVNKILDETFIRLIENYKGEEYFNYTFIKEILEPDRIRKAIDGILDILPSIFNDEL